jgi:hypothetical protein
MLVQITANGTDFNPYFTLTNFKTYFLYFLIVCLIRFYVSRNKHRKTIQPEIFPVIFPTPVALAIVPFVKLVTSGVPARACSSADVLACSSVPSVCLACSLF